jgi:hypothetical protein
MSATASVNELCRHAVSMLDSLLEEHPENLEKQIGEATRCVVRLRNDVSAVLRAADESQVWDGYLLHANAVLSVLMAGHYPIEGIRWDCINEARDALSRLLTESTRFV